MRPSTRHAAAVVCLVGLVVTAMLTTRLVGTAQQLHQEQVHRAAQTVRASLEGNMRALTASLVTLRDVRSALLVRIGEDQSGGLPHAEVDPFMAAAQVVHTTGVLRTARTLGLVRALEPHEQTAYARDRGAEGIEVFPRPLPLARDAYVLEAVFPVASGVGAVGFDMASEPRRRAAIRRARDSGEPSVTMPIELVLPTRDPAVLLFVPTYEGGSTPTTPPVRRARFQGGLVAVLEPQVLLTAAVQAGLRVQAALVDVGEIGLGGTDHPTTEGRALSTPLTVAADTELDLAVGDRRWRLLVSADEGFSGPGLLPAIVVAVAGTLLSVVLAVVVQLTTSREAHASRMVREGTESLRRSRADLQEALSRLRSVDETRRRFLVGISHELRTPLTSIRGFARLLQDDHAAMDDDERLHATLRIAAAAEGLSRQLDGLLDFTEEQEMLPEGVLVPFDLYQVLAERVTVQPPTHQIVLSGVEDQMALGDPRGFSRAVAHVLADARRHSPAGSRIGIWVRPSTDGDQVEVVVDDQGHGVVVDQDGTTFHRFDPAPTAVSGADLDGIRLEAARHLLDAMDGTMHVEEAPIGGARFTLALRAAQGAAQSADMSVVSR